MDSNAVTPGLLYPSDLSRIDTGVDQQAIWAPEALAPLSAYEGWHCQHCQCAGSSVHHRRRPTIVTYQVPEYALPTEDLDQSRLFGLDPQSQSRHEPAMSYTDCSNATYEGCVVPSEFFLGDPSLPEKIKPSVEVWRNPSTRGGKELFNADLRNTHEDVGVPAGPSQAAETFSIPGYSGVLQRPPAQSQGYVSSPSGPSIDTFDKRSVDPSQNFLSPDVCVERNLRPLSSHVRPATELSVDLLRSEVRPTGSTSVMPTSSSTGLVGAPTEQCPSRAYPPRQGTGYVPLRYNGGPMTDAMTTSAPSRIASPSLNEQTLSSVPRSRSYNSFDYSWISSSSTNATPSLDLARFCRRASTPNLSAEGLYRTTNQECVFDSRMNLVEPRKRRQYSASEREGTRTIRAKGACDACRKSKRRCSTQHASQQRTACESSNGVGKQKSLTKRSLSTSLLTQSLKENTASLKSRPIPLRDTSSKFNDESPLTYDSNMLSAEANGTRCLPVQVDVNNISTPNCVCSSNPAGAGSWPASYANELGNEVITTPYFPSEANVAAQLLHDQVNPMRSSDYGHSSTHLNQDSSPSENCTPFTPMDITSGQEWYEDNAIGEMGLNKGDDGFDVQDGDRTEDFGGLLSSDVDFLSLADINMEP